MVAVTSIFISITVVLYGFIFLFFSFLFISTCLFIFIFSLFNIFSNLSFPRLFPLCPSWPPCFLSDFSLLLVITFLYPFVPDGLFEFELSFLFWFFNLVTSVFNFWFSFSNFSIFLSLSFNCSLKPLISFSCSFFNLFISFLCSFFIVSIFNVKLSTFANNSSICLNISFILPSFTIITSFLIWLLYYKSLENARYKYVTKLLHHKN